MGTAFVITSVDNATCAGKEDSSASRKDQEDRASSEDPARSKYGSIFDIEQNRKGKTKS